MSHFLGMLQPILLLATFAYFVTSLLCGTLYRGRIPVVFAAVLATFAAISFSILASRHVSPPFDSALAIVALVAFAVFPIVFFSALLTLYPPNPPPEKPRTLTE